MHMLELAGQLASARLLATREDGTPCRRVNLAMKDKRRLSLFRQGRRASLPSREGAHGEKSRLVFSHGVCFTFD
jgi:hypothetical protein